MALLVVKRGPTSKPAIPKTGITDWDSSLYSYWLQKIALNPGLYDNAKKSHASGGCKCGCTRSYVLEVRKKK